METPEILTLVQEWINSSSDKLDAINRIRNAIHEVSPNRDQPVDFVRWVPIDMVECKNNADIRERNHGMLPIVVINKSINERMASTVRHNRARGKHSVEGMSNMVFELLDNGWKDEDICNQLGLEPEELLKLKHITGFSKLFENAEYKKAWESKTQLLAKKKYKEEHPDEQV